MYITYPLSEGLEAYRKLQAAMSPTAPSSSRTVAPRLTMPPRPPRSPNQARDNP